MAIDLNTLASIGTIVLAAAGLAGLVLKQGKDLRADLTGELTKFRTELKDEITGVRTELKNEITAVRTEAKADHQAAMEAIEKVNDAVLQTRTELGSRLTSLEERTYDIATRLTPPPTAQHA